MQTLETPAGTYMSLKLPEADFITLQAVTSIENKLLAGHAESQTIDDSVQYLTTLGLGQYLEAPANWAAYQKTDADPFNTMFRVSNAGKRIADLGIIGPRIDILMPNDRIVEARRVHDVENSRKNSSFGEPHFIGASDILRGLLRRGITVYHELPMQDARERTFSMRHAA